MPRWIQRMLLPLAHSDFTQTNIKTSKRIEGWCCSGKEEEEEETSNSKATMKQTEEETMVRERRRVLVVDRGVPVHS